MNTLLKFFWEWQIPVVRTTNAVSKLDETHQTPEHVEYMNRRWPLEEL